MNRLENYTKQIRGITYSPKDISEIPLEEYLPILKANNIKEDGLDTSNLIYIHKSKIKTEQLIKKGDLLIAASSGSKDIVGKNIYFESDFNGSFGAFCKVVRPKDNINSKYLSVFFKTPIYKRHIRKLIQGANINNLKNEDINSLDIPVFSENKQAQIAEILSQADNLITQRKQSITLLDEFLKSSFLEMFGDPITNEKGWKYLSGEKYLSKLTVGVVIRPASHYVEKGVIALRSLNIKPNKIDLTNVVYFSVESNKNTLSKSILNEGDVVFVRTGATGTAAIIPKELDGSNCIDLIITRPKENLINPKYLVFFFNSEIGKRIVTSKEVGGIQKHFNIGALKKMKIPIPNIDVQNKFAAIVEKVENLKKDYETSLTELENLYGVLSQKAFKGELNLSKVDVEISNEKIKTPVAGSLEPSKEDDKIPQVSKKEIEKFKYILKTKRDITNLSLADYYGIPIEIQARRENIDFDFIGDDLFYQFLLKDHFKKEPFTTVTLYEKLHNYFYHVGQIDYNHNVWKEIIFKFLDLSPPLLEQYFDEDDKTIKLKLTDEAFKA